MNEELRENIDWIVVGENHKIYPSYYAAWRIHLITEYLTTLLYDITDTHLYKYRLCSISKLCKSCYRDSNLQLFKDIKKEVRKLFFKKNIEAKVIYKFQNELVQLFDDSLSSWKWAFNRITKEK